MRASSRAGKSGLTKRIVRAGMVSVVFLILVAIICIGIGGAVAQRATTAAAEWPTYLHDNQRSGVTAATVKVPLRLKWVYECSVAPHPAWPPPHSTPVEGILEPPRLIFDDAYHVAAGRGAVHVRPPRTSDDSRPRRGRGRHRRHQYHHHQ